MTKHIATLDLDNASAALSAQMSILFALRPLAPATRGEVLRAVAERLGLRVIEDERV